MRETQLVAPCGINCSLCLGFQRDKNKCSGCNSTDNSKPSHCSNCSIKMCEKRTAEAPNYCYSCKEFPCRRIKQLDKRYTAKYNTSPIQNLLDIKEGGIKKFIKKDMARWKCDKCQMMRCMHRAECLNCAKQSSVI